MFKPILGMLGKYDTINRKLPRVVQENILSYLMPKNHIPVCAGNYIIMLDRDESSEVDQYILYRFLLKDANGTKVYMNANDDNLHTKLFASEYKIRSIKVYDDLGVQDFGSHNIYGHIFQGGCISTNRSCLCCFPIDPKSQFAILDLLYTPGIISNFNNFRPQHIHQFIQYDKDFKPFITRNKIRTHMGRHFSKSICVNTDLIVPRPYAFFENRSVAPPLFDNLGNILDALNTYAHPFEPERELRAAMYTITYPSRENLEEIAEMEAERLARPASYNHPFIDEEDTDTEFDMISDHSSLLDVDELSVADDVSLPPIEVIADNDDDDELSATEYPIQQTDAFVSQGIWATRFPSGRIRADDSASLIPAIYAMLPRNHIISDDDSVYDNNDDTPYNVHAYPTTVVAFASRATTQNTSQPNVIDGPIYGLIDTGAQMSLMKQQFTTHKAFKNVRTPNREITVTGISSHAAPLRVTHVGEHAILGQVLFGNFSTNLIGVPQLLRNGFGDNMNITRWSNQAVVYTGHRNHNGLYECDINVTPVAMEAFNASIN